VRIFEAVAAGVSIRQIAHDLTQEGIPAPLQLQAMRGLLPAGRAVTPIWSRAQIVRIIHHPAYWGEHAAYRWRNTNVKVRPAETGITRKIRHQNERDVDDPDRVALPDAAPALVSKELAERALARLAKNKEDNPGRNPDPLATLFRSIAICGHCGGRMHTSSRVGSEGRVYKCASRANGGTCPGGIPSIYASALDPAGWADVRAWISDPENISRLLAEWEQEERSAENSVASRLEAVEATIKTLRDKMNRLAETIADTSDRESRRVLQEKLDTYAAQARKEEGKRERLMREAHDAAQYAKDARDVREWISVVSERTATASRDEQRATLLMLGAQVTIWRKDYVHPDGWPQRYKIELRFTGFTGAPVTLPASQDEILNQTTG
jgi:Recombinase/Recombinase zinc beta ribbon domain